MHHAFRSITLSGITEKTGLGQEHMVGIYRLSGATYGLCSFFMIGICVLFIALRPYTERLGVTVQLARAFHGGREGHRQFKLMEEVKHIGGLAQLARAFAWHARGHRFDSGIPTERRSEKVAFFFIA